MRARDFLTELGNAPYQYQYKSGWSDPGREWYYTAETPAGLLIVEFNHRNITIDISFNVNGAYEISGRGDQFKIFSTVFDVITRELPKIMSSVGEVRRISFGANADEPSRVSLYRRGSSKISKLLGPDWEFREEPAFEGNVTFHWYNRKRKQQ